MLRQSIGLPVAWWETPSPSPNAAISLNTESPHLQSDNSVRLLSHCGQHDNRKGRARSDLAAKRETAFSWEHQVEDHEVDRGGGQALAHFDAVPHAGDTVAVLAQEPGYEIEDLGVVINDQYVRAAFEVTPSHFAAQVGYHIQRRSGFGPILSFLQGCGHTGGS